MIAHGSMPVQTQEQASRAASGESSKTSHASASTRASSRKNRVYVFRDFLLKTYKQYLAKESLVLDVAGGKGALSWLLTNVDDMDNVIVADPRLPDHAPFHKSIRYLCSNPDEALHRAIPNQATYQPLAALLPKLKGKDPFRSPRHLQILVDKHLVSAVRCFLNSRDENSWESFWKDSSRRALEFSSQDDCIIMDSQIIDAESARNVILGLRLIVGFHPDQDTEACMDLATLLEIPFCVCPCCLFPCEFPDRKTETGERVRCYDEFIPYLQRKYPIAQVQTLEFHETKTARNIVLYTLPEHSGSIDIDNISNLKY